MDRLALISYHTCPLASPGQGKAGGMNVYLRELSRYLGRLGMRVDLFTRGHAESGHQVEELEDQVRLVHLDAGPPSAAPDSLGSFLPQFLDGLREFARSDGSQYKVVHSHYWLSGWVGQRVATEWGVPHVVTFHTLARIKMQARAGQREDPQRAAIERELISTADMVVASSAHEKQLMERLYDAPSDRVHLVPCGVDLSLFRPLDIGEARKRLGLNGERVIVCVGRLEPIKGLELMLQSAAIMEGKESLKVLVVGGNATNDGDWAGYLQERARDLGLQDVVVFEGMVDQKLLPLYYNAADVCVVPSHYESFGLAALEALACGTPVVAARVGGLPSVVQHGRTGYLLPARCPEPLADSLEVILTSGGLRESMSREARKRAEEMGWGNVAKRMRDLYGSL